MSSTRRSVVRSLLGAPLLAAPAWAQSTPIRVGFVPVIGAASLFVLDGAGWARDAGLTLATTKFDSGPAAHSGICIGHVRCAGHRYRPGGRCACEGARCLGNRGGRLRRGRPSSRRLTSPHASPRTAMRRLPRLLRSGARTGRRAKIATLPPGGVPNVTLNHWLFRDRQDGSRRRRSRVHRHRGDPAGDAGRRDRWCDGARASGDDCAGAKPKS